MDGKVRILTYHRVGVPRGGCRYEKRTVRVDRFRRQVRWLRALGYEFVGMDGVHSWLCEGGSIASRPVVLTFDDGYADLREHVFPLATDARIPMVVYLVTDLQADTWRSGTDGGPLDLLSWDQVREMAKVGVVFGSHTRTHPRLTQCGEEALREEMVGSKKRIEDEVGAEVRHFCYPYGDVDDRVAQAAGEAGYATAVTTRRGTVVAGADPLRLPRLTVGKRMGIVRFLMRVTVRG